jgi:hypothetical protein
MDEKQVIKQAEGKLEKTWLFMEINEEYEA